jgi:hypothetical protein
MHTLVHPGDVLVCKHLGDLAGKTGSSLFGGVVHQATRESGPYTGIATAARRLR